MRFFLFLMLLAAGPMNALAAYGRDSASGDATLINRSFTQLRARLPEPLETITDPAQMPMAHTGKGYTMYVYEPVRFIPVSPRIAYNSLYSRSYDCRLSIIVRRDKSIAFIGKHGRDCGFSVSDALTR